MLNLATLTWQVGNYDVVLNREKSINKSGLDWQCCNDFGIYAVLSLSPPLDQATLSKGENPMTGIAKVPLDDCPGQRPSP